MYGQNIRLFRKQKGMNQHELGADMSVMCRAFRQMKPEEQEKYLAVGKALFASAFAPAAPAQDDDAAE